MNFKTTTALVASALLLTACQTFQLTEGGKPTLVGDAYYVTPTQDWSKLKRGTSEIWTINGSSLDNVTFFFGIEDGEPLHEHINSLASKDAPKFQADMDKLELAELLKDTLSHYEHQDVNIEVMDSARFCAQDGVRMEMTYVTKGGLDKRLIAMAAVEEEKLNMAIYSAPTEYYFDHYKEAAVGLMDSLSKEKPVEETAEKN